MRERGRREGKKLAQRLVSRTRLVKGLEFDHTIVFDVPQLDLRNLYVALTPRSLKRDRCRVLTVGSLVLVSLGYGLRERSPGTRAGPGLRE